MKEIFALAIKNHQKNNLKVAEQLYKKILKKNPNHANTHNNLGVLFEQLGQSQKAISYFKKAKEKII